MADDVWLGRNVGKGSIQLHSSRDAVGADLNFRKPSCVASKAE